MQTIIRVEKLAKTFNQHQALHAVDLNIHHGEMVALLGPSGSGKSTLLRHLSGLITGDKSAGSHIELLGRTVQREGRLARDIRKSRANTGYIFQQFNLVNRLSVLENVLIGALGSTPFWRTCFSYFTREQKQRALQALTRVGMVHFAHQRVSTLSGGQQQRVAIARALMQQAKVILADEPIASLDPESARIVMDTLRDINQNDGITVVVTLHQVDYALRYCERIVALRQGHVFYDGSSQQFDNGTAICRRWKRWIAPTVRSSPRRSRRMDRRVTGAC
ncbi:TPA: phosphonate ABC transporter ATP-binding protein [Escherichia coli]